jgi:hypothetical protein
MKKNNFDEFPDATVKKHIKDVPLYVNFIRFSETTVVIGCRYEVFIITDFDECRSEFFDNFVDALDYMKKIFVVHDLSAIEIKLGS